MMTLPDETKSWMLKKSPLDVWPEGMIGFVCKCGAVLRGEVVALRDVHVEVAVESDPVV